MLYFPEQPLLTWTLAALAMAWRVTMGTYIPLFFSISQTLAILVYVLRRVYYRGTGSVRGCACSCGLLGTVNYVAAHVCLPLGIPHSSLSLASLEHICGAQLSSRCHSSSGTHSACVCMLARLSAAVLPSIHCCNVHADACTSFLH
jgi:hypothetical protein